MHTSSKSTICEINKSIKFLLIASFALLSTIQIAAQNSPSLFKLSMYQTDTDPEWVDMMYSDNPNVWAVDLAYDAYYREHPFEKSIHTQNYKYWRKTINTQSYLTDDGYIHIPPYKETKSNRLKRNKEWANNEKSMMMANWTPLGPFETFWENDGNVKKSSQVNAYTIDQSLSNPNNMLCGTETGDVYKSTDKAANWVCVTDNVLLNAAVHTVKFHPTNSNIALFATEREVYRTVDGGTNWTNVYTPGGNKYFNDILFVPPANPADPYIVMISGGRSGNPNGGLYRSVDGGANFVETSALPSYDLEIKPGSNNIVYLLQSKIAAQNIQFYKSTDRGASFTEFNTGYYPGSTMHDNTYAGARMTVTPANPEYIYVALLGNDVSLLQDVFWIGVYKSTDGGNSWTLPAGDPGGPYSAAHKNITGFNPTMVELQQNTGLPYHQEYYNFGIAASHTNAEHFLIGALNLFKSENGGATYTGMGGYTNEVGYAGYRHPDNQEIEINGNDVWVANDGGIDKYSADWATHISYNLGINGTEYWGFDTGWNQDVLVGGRYHNGDAVLYENYPAGKARSMGGGEKATGYVNKGINRQVHFSDTQDRLIPEVINGNLLVRPNLGIYPSEPNERPEQGGEIEPDPSCYNHMYLAKDNILHKSLDGGQNFNVVNTFGAVATDFVTRIEISRSNPNVIYVCQRIGGTNTVIWRTTDKGASWGQIGLPPGIASGAGFFISLSATDDQHLFMAVANGGFSNEKVYVTLDAGANWTNLTTAALDGERPEQLMHQYGTNGGVYLATSGKVFYRNNTHADWQLFTTGTPADFRPERMRPFYKESKVRIATRNRGIWSSPLFENSAPIAQPMANKLNATCFDDLIQFEDHSVLNHTNATWAWTFNPAPAFVDDANKRNPTVRFGAAGAYDVTLTVTNGAGVSDTKTITDMITLGNTCFCPPYAGASALYSEVGTAVQQFDNSCCITLTPAQNFKVGAVHHFDKINLGNSFELKFNIDLGNIDGNDADGTAFIMQNNGFNELGGGVGVNGINNSVSVIFKTFGSDNIEVWHNGDGNNQANNAPPIAGNGLHPVTIKWDAATTTLTVDWEDNGVDLTYNNDIVTSVFGGNPANIVWGFTAGTGGFNAEHKVCNIQMNIMGGPCPPTLALSNTNIAGNYAASVSINASNMVNVNGATVLSAPTVTLDNVFTTPLGTTFEVNNIGCNGQAPDGTCAAPYILTCGTPFNGDTANGTSTWSNYDGGMQNNYSGKETIHTLTVPANTQVVVSLTSNDDMDLFIANTCTNTPVYSGTAGGNEMVTIPAMPTAMTYYLIVERWNGMTAAYTLSCT